MKTRSPTIAKVTRPIPTGVYRRKRLFDLLDRKREYPVIWVSGPPGCGKTTLVTSFLEDKKFPCLWYQADEGDADPATFFYYLGLAAKKATPRKRRPLPLLTPEYLPGLSTFTLRYFENLFQRLRAPSFLVFDNYQEVPIESSFHEVIRHGLSNIPKGVKVVLVSRRDPPPVLIHLQANNLMEMIGWQDLRLTLKECNDIVELQTRQEVSTGAMKYLHTITDGWVAGLMLMLKTADMEKIDPRELDKVPTEKIFDYFMGEIFGKVDEKSQKFLLKTAFLPKMTGDMAEALTGFESADRILSQLNRNHSFTERRFRSSPAFEYHPLFRDFLLSRAKETFSPEFLSELRLRAAVLLEEAGQTEAAIELMRDAGNWKGMVQLILKHAQEMLAQGRNRPLKEWLCSIPKDIFETTPWLLYWMGACRLFVNTSSSTKYFEQAFEKFQRQEDVAGIFLSWSGIVNSIVFASENFKPLDKWIATLEETVDLLGSVPSEDIEAQVASSMLMALTHRRPQHPEIEAWAERALSLIKGPVAIDTKVQTLAYLFRHHLHAGNFEKATLAMTALKRFLLNRTASHLSQILAMLVETVYFYCMGEFKKCQNIASEGLALSRKTGVQVMDFMLLGHYVACAMEVNDLSTAENMLDQMDLSLDGRSQLDMAFYHSLRARKALIQKDLNKALIHADLSFNYNSKTGDLPTVAFHHLLKAYVMIELGEYSKAAKHITDAFHISSEIKSTLFQSYAFLLEAQSALDQRNETFGLKALRKALSNVKSCGYFYLFWDVPSKTAQLYATALEAGIEVDYVQDIIRKRKLVLDGPPLHVENWPWAIQIYTLGRFDMVIDGKPFKSPPKTQKKPMEMLKMLISFGKDQKVSKSQLSDILWSEADGDRAQRSFDITLHRLRQLLGHDKAISLRGGKLSIDLRYCWVDGMAFERILKQAENYIKTEDRKNAVQSLEKAVALYKGPFLGGEGDQPWAISYNERLRSKFLRAIERLGNYLEEGGDLNRAVDCFQRAIEVDDVAEMFYRRLMSCLKQLGRKTDALSVYQHCERTLLSSLGLEPSPETKAIRKSLFEE
jgi:LuxR family maltose regulon positive regulatory protein